MANYVVSNLNDAGAGSLRAAIDAANLSADASNTISFSVAGTITLASALPSITANVSINATTAPGYSVGSSPVLTLDFNGHAGLVFALSAQGSSIYGLALGNADGHGLTLNAGSVTLDKNYIGLAADGTALGNSGDGIYVGATSSGNFIGLNESQVSGVVGNVISANDGNGITIAGGSGHTLVANRIGTSSDGDTALGNGGHGIWLTNATTGNTIGGTVYVDAATGQVNDPTGDKGTVTPVFIIPPLGNQISGNAGHGVLIDARSENNVLNGNFVGTTADGNADLGNGGDGVQILNADNNSLIGCTFVDNPFVYYNVLSGNGGNGLHITNSDNVIVQANFFGVGANNAVLVGNDANGILVDGDSQNTTVGGVIPLGNVSGGNLLNGIYVTDSASDFITFNTFGGLFAFQGAAPNGQNGVLIDSTGGGNEVRTNVFSGNLGHGIEISGNAHDVLIDPNIVGLDTIGSAKLANGGNGLLIGGTAHNITVGGTAQSVIPQNTFSGNDGYGIAIVDQAYNVHVFNSAIGTNVTKVGPLGNASGGVLLSSVGTGNLIGGISTSADDPQANTIGGNAGDGVTLSYGSFGQSVIGNEFGLDRFGLPTIPNEGAAIGVNGTMGNVIDQNTGQDSDGVTYGLQPQALYTQLQALYVGYFGRAGDISGYEYWSGTAVTDLLQGQSVDAVMTSIGESFAASSENAPYTALVGATLDRNNTTQVNLVTDFINQAYQYLFSRVADTGGFAFWFDKLFSGQLQFSDLIYDMAQSAQDNDQVVLNNKVSGALYLDQMVVGTGTVEPSLLQLQAAVRPVTSETTLLTSKLVTDTLVGQSGAAVTDTSIFNDGTFVTGVRGDHDGNVILTGNQVIAGTGNTQAMLYKGPMLDTGLGTVYLLAPEFEGQTVVSSTFYGPNTSVFNSEIGLGRVRAVGSYVNDANDGTHDHSMIYEGPVSGLGGTWTQIDVPSVLVGGQAVANTILHSTMGDLAVGNYDLQGVPASGNAFIYNIRTGEYTVFDSAFGGTDQLTTAYGIWQDEEGGSRYTIVGGSKHGIGANEAFVAHYDSITGEFSDIRYYTYEGRPEAITHFEGITAVAGGFNLIATTDQGAAFASITMAADGSFSDAHWTLNNMTGADLTTGNSVFQNIAMGIYEQTDSSGINTYAGLLDQASVSAAGGLIMTVGAQNLSYGLTPLTSTGAIIVGSANAGNVLGGSIGNDTFVGAQVLSIADSYFTGGGADSINLAAGRVIGSAIGLYASNTSSDLIAPVPGSSVSALAGSVVSATDVPQLGWWGQGSGKFGGPVSDEHTNTGLGTGTSASMTRVLQFESGTDLAEIDRLDFSLTAYSGLLRDVSPASGSGAGTADGPGLGAAVFSNVLLPGSTVTVADANVLVFSNSVQFADAQALAQSLANAATDIGFGSLQTHDLNHYLVLYEDTTGHARIADLNIQSVTDFSSTELIAGMTLSVSDVVQLVGVSVDQVYDGNIQFVA